MNKRLALKTVNKAIQVEFPELELNQGNGYLYFTPVGNDKTYEHAFYMIDTSSVGVCRLNHLSLEKWIEEAKEVDEKVKKEIKILEEK